MRIAPRPSLAVTAAAVLLVLPACSTGPTGQAATAPEPSTDAAAEEFPVTIEHAFGETTIDSLPERVATVSWVNADVALALGVVPVGMPLDEWGANDNGSTPWKDAALEEAGAAIGTEAAPVQYSEADGINYNAIAQLTPDLILASYSGLTAEEYEKLSKIADVLAYPEVPYGTAWQDSTLMIGQALGRSAQAKELVQQTEQTIEDKAGDYPQIAGKSFIYGNLEPDRGAGVNVYTTEDNRSRFMSQIGMQPAPVVDENSGGDAFFFEWSPERADELESDVFVTWVPEASTVQQIEEDPLLGQIPAVADGALVADSDNTLTLAISAASPLSLPWALDEFLPQIAAAADNAT